jgi:hypothetical protein
MRLNKVDLTMHFTSSLYENFTFGFKVLTFSKYNKRLFSWIASVLNPNGHPYINLETYH